MITEAPKQFTEALNALVEAIRPQLREAGHVFSSTKGVRVAFCNKFTVDNGILGAFSWQTPDKILLAPSPLGEDEWHWWARELASTYVHELHHRWQYQRWGLVKYAIKAIPVIRNWTLEASAKAIELEADRLLGTEKE